MSNNNNIIRSKNSLIPSKLSFIAASAFAALFILPSTCCDNKSKKDSIIDTYKKSNIEIIDSAYNAPGTDRVLKAILGELLKIDSTNYVQDSTIAVYDSIIPDNTRRINDLEVDVNEAYQRIEKNSSDIRYIKENCCDPCNNDSTYQITVAELDSDVADSVKKNISVAGTIDKIVKDTSALESKCTPNFSAWGKKPVDECYSTKVNAEVEKLYSGKK